MECEDSLDTCARKKIARSRGRVNVERGERRASAEVAPLAASPRGAFPRRPMGVAAGAVPRAVRAATGAGVGYAVLTAVPAVERPDSGGPCVLARAAAVPLGTRHDQF